MDDIHSQDIESISSLAFEGLPPWVGPAILLVDLDAFFASVEQLDHPGWRGKPVIVGGSPDKRGVVSTASYEAREFGVHSAMPSITAKKLCPQAIWTPGNFSRYHEVSHAVMAILNNETPLVQQVSIDEAFVDVSPTAINKEHPVSVAQRIQQQVAALGVTCSIGVASTKSMAKIASDIEKPSGLTVVMPGSERCFINKMPVRALSGIGPSAQAKLKALGVETLGELYDSDDDVVISKLGQQGYVALNRVRGLEDSAVTPEKEVKSISSETSFANDLSNRNDILAALDAMASKVGRRLRQKNLKGITLSLKVRFSNFSTHSIQRTLPLPSDDEFLFQSILHDMLKEVWEPGIALRLVGVGVSGFDAPLAVEQLSLFEGEGAENDNNIELDERGRNLQTTADRVKDRFGEDALIYGRELRLNNL